MTKDEELELAKEIIRQFLDVVPPIPYGEREQMGLDLQKIFVLRNIARSCFRELDHKLSEHDALLYCLTETLLSMGWTKHATRIQQVQGMGNILENTLEDVLGRLLRMIPHEKCTGLHKQRAFRAVQLIRHLLPAA